MSRANDAWELRDGLRAFWRHKGKVACTLVLVGAAAVAAVALWPRSYPSEARLMVRLGRSSVALDPTATTGDVATSIGENRENEINSVVDVLESRMLHEQVVKQIGAETILESGQGKADGRLSAVRSKLSAVGDWLEQMHITDPVSNFERAVQRLQKGVQVHRSKDSSVVAIEYAAANPELAQQIVQTYVDVFLQEHVRVNRTSGSYEFFVAQQAKIGDELQAAEEDLRDTKNELGIASIEGQRTALQQQIGAVETGLLTTNAELASVTAAVASQEAILEQVPERIETEVVSGFPNNAGDQMRKTLYDLEIQHLELTAKYTADHPAVVSVEQQLDEARKIVAAQEVERRQTTSTINLNRQTLELQLYDNRTQQKALQAKLAALTEQRVALEDRLKKLNGDELRIVQLQRQVEVATVAHQDYLRDAELARIDEALEDDRISNISVVQNASFVAKPVAPRRGMIAALALIVGFSVSLGVVMASEALNPSLRSAHDVEEELELPVLVNLT